MKLSEKDMLQLVNDVEREFASYLNKSENLEVEIAKNEYTDQEKEELDSIYTSMTKSEAEIHFNSLKKALYGEQEEIPVSMEKSEKEIEEISMMKSEMVTLSNEKEILAKENADLKKSFEELKASITSFVANRAPQRKSITDVSLLNKTENNKENLSKSEIDQILKEKVRNPDMTRRDREAVNNYYNNGSKELIKHLL